MLGFIIHDLSNNMISGYCCAMQINAECKLMQLQNNEENQIRWDRDVGRNPMLEIAK